MAGSERFNFNLACLHRHCHSGIFFLFLAWLKQLTSSLCPCPLAPPTCQDQMWLYQMAHLVDYLNFWLFDRECSSNCQIWLTSATNRAFSVQHACGLPTTPTPRADVTQLRMLDLDAGKDRQVMKWIQLHLCMSWSASMLAMLRYNGKSARGMCSRKL